VVQHNACWLSFVTVYATQAAKRVGALFTTARVAWAPREKGCRGYPRPRATHQHHPVGITPRAGGGPGAYYGILSFVQQHNAPKHPNRLSSFVSRSASVPHGGLQHPVEGWPFCVHPCCLFVIAQASAWLLLPVLSSLHLQGACCAAPPLLVPASVRASGHVGSVQSRPVKVQAGLRVHVCACVSLLLPCAALVPCILGSPWADIGERGCGVCHAALVDCAPAACVRRHALLPPCWCIAPLHASP
jgi:hypothetical protein